jgi:HEAT repeat protein
MTESAYSDAELDAAIAALSDPERFKAAEARVMRAAPQLQQVLDEAMASSGGLLDTVQAQQIREAAGHPDPADRMAAISRLMSEEARLGMFVGVAVGWELALELELNRDTT